MPADPHRCRYYAAHCFALERRARDPKSRQIFSEMAETWNQLATESDQALFLSIPVMELGEPDDALPNPLKLRLGEYA
jgi:hypothetical protein